MMSNIKPQRQRLSTRTKLFFVGCVVVLVSLVIEIVCWAALSVLHGRPVGWKAINTYRTVVAREADPNETARTETEFQEQLSPWAAGLREESNIHPYLGFVADPPPDLAQRAPRYRPEAGNFGFPYNFHSIFNRQSDDVVIVAVVGGSVAQQIGGQGRPFQLLDTELEADSRFHGKDVKVINLALGGYKQPQQLMVLTYFLSLGAHFDIVVNFDGFNEVTLPIRDNYEVGVNPYYPRSWRYRLANTDADELNARGVVIAIDDSRRWLARKASRRPWRWSFTASLAWWVTDGRLKNEAARRQIAVMSHPGDDLDPERAGPKLSFDTEDELRAALAASWRRCSVGIQGLAEVHGFEYYHFLQPNQYDSGSKTLTLEEERQAFDPESRFVDLVGKGYPLLRREAFAIEGAGVAFEDLGRLFADIEETVYVDPCCHFNRFGVQTIVSRIVERISDGPTTPAMDPSNPGYNPR